MVVTIQISDEVWHYLMSEKKKPSQTFDDIIKRLIENEKRK